MGIVLGKRYFDSVFIEHLFEDQKQMNNVQNDISSSGVNAGSQLAYLSGNGSVSRVSGFAKTRVKPV